MRIVIFAALTLLAAPAGAQDKYRLPPSDVVKLVDAPPTPRVSISPDSRWMLEVERASLPPIADVARLWIGLAGIRIDPRSNSRHSSYFDVGIVLRDLLGENETRIPLPEGARVAGTRWSHTSRAFTYVLRGDAGMQLWHVAVEAPEEPVLVTDRLNAVFGLGYTWMPETGIACMLVPKGRGDAPEAPTVASGPNIQESTGEKSPLRTYQDLSRNPHDDAVFEHYGASELALWSPAEGLRTTGRPGIYTRIDSSPDGQHLIVTEVRRPFSWLMPYYLFPQRTEVRDLAGRTEHVVAELSLGETIPLGGVRTGPRSVGWIPGADATLVWVEALDGGDPKREVEHRDRWQRLAAPFDGTPGEILRTEHRATGLTWTENPSVCMSSEYDRDRRWTRTLLVNVDDPTVEPEVLEDRSRNDRYRDPGRPVVHYDARGSRIVRQDGDWIYRIGQGAAADGARPFLDRQNLETFETERLWRCSPGSYESVVALVQSGTERKPSFVTRYESPDEPPNWRLRDLEQAGQVVALTNYPDPAPELRGIKKELLTYERSDGVQLSATLYGPKDYEEGTRLPLLVWAYPREFNDPATAGQISGSPYRFTRFGGSSHLFLLTQGYAVLDGATIPIVGDPQTMNDTFVEQIVASARAAIDVVVAMGIADPDRIAVGGHSYGAFMTANLLAHSDLFRAGIARSGTYNRTLTPFGFQSERRTVWEAPETYFAVSPFLHADGINEPILLIHGEEDSNSGTFPLQSRRLFQAIKGLGGTSRLVFLPHESHGYRARESVLHVLAEMIDWLDRHMQ
ncbi:MAG: prolyl oligopeptidase family serine peptidase [Planctomycetota bacterium]|nr:prolyl oligopeptidase family serine peptidase [Planctomycetota bacterium]